MDWIIYYCGARVRQVMPGFLCHQARVLKMHWFITFNQFYAVFFSLFFFRSPKIVCHIWVRWTALCCLCKNVIQKSIGVIGILLYIYIYSFFHLSLAGNVGHLTWLRRQQPQEQHYPFLSVCAEFLCIQTIIWMPVLQILNMHANADAGDCTQTVQTPYESLHQNLKIPCYTGESNSHQYCPWL